MLAIVRGDEVAGGEGPARLQPGDPRGRTAVHATHQFHVPSNASVDGGLWKVDEKS